MYAMFINFLFHFLFLSVSGLPDLFSETIPKAVKIAYVTDQRAIIQFLSLGFAMLTLGMPHDLL
jgi:hypothetical protein